MDTLTVARSIDRRGKTITTFVVFDVAAELEELDQGEILEVLTDEFEPFESDMAAWCKEAGHKLVGSFIEADRRRFLIKKGAAPAVDQSLAMVISTAKLDELISPLGFALAAALEGVAVSLYFQGPGVRVLARGHRPKLAGWSRPFSRFAAANMAESGHILPQDKLRQLRALGATIYVCGPSMDRFNVEPNELIFDEVSVVEYLTFMAVMKRADIHIYS